MKAWGWVVQYGVAIVLALLLGVILGHLPLFHETVLGSSKLRASHVVQFVSYGGALVVLWLLGSQAALHSPQERNWFACLRHIITPLTTLIAVTAGHAVLLLVAEPFLGKTGKGIYNWIFVFGIVGAAFWLVVAWFLKAAPELKSLEVQWRGKWAAAPQGKGACPECKRPVPSGAKFCSECGQKLALA